MVRAMPLNATARRSISSRLSTSARACRSPSDLKLLGREAHAFQNLIPPENGPRHAVERHRQALDLIAAVDFGASVQISLGHLLDGGMQNPDRANPTGRLQ